MATVLAHVCKISTAARRFDLRFEADGTANATHTMVCAPLLGLGWTSCSIYSSSSHTRRTVADRQTLCVCSEIDQGPFDNVSNTSCRLTKRYMCAANAFSAVETGCDSFSPDPSTAARRYARNGFCIFCKISQNVTYVMVSARVAVANIRVWTSPAAKHACA